MTQWKQTLFLASALAAAIPAITIPAAAQEAQSQQADDSGLDVIVVTANRREEDLQTIPVAVTAFTPLQLDAAGIENTVDLVRFTPGLTGGLNTGTGGANTYYMRGLGSTEQVATFDVPVATYVDEVYIARQSVNNFTLFDVERVEILRGPQGTLFGRNSSAGAVVVTNRKPGSEFGGFIEGSYGSFERSQVRATVDVPLTDKVLTKVSAFYVDDGGFSTGVNGANRGVDLNGEESWGVRGAVRLLPSDTATWDLAVDYSDQSKTTIGTTPGDPDYVVRSGLPVTECDQNMVEKFLTQRAGNCSNIKTGGLTSNLTFDTDLGALSFITGYRATGQSFALDFGLGGSPSPRGGFVIVNEVTNRQLTQEVKLVGENDQLKWVAGAFYLTEDNKNTQLDSFTTAPAAAATLILGNRVLFNDATAMAVYAQADIKLNDELTATIGGRYTDEEKSIDFQDRNARTYPAPFINAAPSLTNRATTANIRAFGIPTELDVSKFTPKVALTWAFAEDKMAFVSATNGFKSGGWNARDANAFLTTVFKPEEVWSYEVGAKTQWLDNRLRANVTLYKQDTKDVQILSGFINPVSNAVVFLSQNIGTLATQGVELELAARPVDNLDLFASASFSSGKYEDIPLATYRGVDRANATLRPFCETRNAAGQDPLQCVSTIDAPVRFPDTQFTLGGTYTVPVGGLGGDILLGGAVSYASAFWTSSANDTGIVNGFNLSYVPETTLVNVGVTYRSAGGTWEAALDCRNCTEEYYFTASLVGLGYPNDPRRVTFRLRLNY